jgi:RHS repeat-associated protein
MSVLFVGNVHLAAAGTYNFAANAGDSGANSGHIEMSIDDQSVLDADLPPNLTAGSYTNATAGSDHTVILMYHTLAGHDSAAGMHLVWEAPGAGSYSELDSSFTPGLGLTTSSSSDTNDATHAPALASAVTYGRAETRVATSTVVAPSGSHLVTGVDRGSAGDGNFYRVKSTTLPAGNATTNTYYGNTETRANPCVSGSAAVSQRGATKLVTGPDGRVVESVYDDAGRTVASRVQGDSAWTCQRFDDRGRPTVQTRRDGSTVTVTYAGHGNPLETDVTSSAGTIRSVLDLDGQQVGYADVWGSGTLSTYDTAGHLTFAGGSNSAIGYGLDPAGLVTSVSSDTKIIAVPTYASTGEMTSVSYPAADATHAGNGTQVTLATDGAGQTAGVAVTGPGGAAITSDAVVRSQAGQVLTDTVDGASSPTFAYSYDDVGRLVSATVPGENLTYGFGATSGCGSGSGVLANPELNSDRTSETITPTSGTPTTYRYCYGTGDQLLSSTDPAVGTLAYDSHGNTTTMAGETHTYDAVDAHISTTKGSTNVTYVRDATGRIVERDLNGTATAKYSFGGPTDASSIVLDASGALAARTIALPGGVILTQQASGDTWSYTNVHGDVTATANASGVKQGTTAMYDPFGNALSGTAPDNRPGNMDDQWLGGPQRPTEHQTGLAPIVEMGHRQYDPVIGRFLSIDPVQGGSASQYDYTDQDPINSLDLDGTQTVHFGTWYLPPPYGGVVINGTGCGGHSWNFFYCGDYYVHFGALFTYLSSFCNRYVRGGCGKGLFSLMRYAVGAFFGGISWVVKVYLTIGFGVASWFSQDGFDSVARQATDSRGQLRGCLVARIPRGGEAVWSLASCQTG